MTAHSLLLIDDNDALRDVVRENLELDGYTVFAASSGGEGMRILQVKRVDAILLDLMLPDADGLSLIAKMRALTEAPVIVISGKGGWVDKVVGLEMGADDYLAKPFEMKELAARIKAAIRRTIPKAPPAADVLPRQTRFGRHVLDAARFQAFDDTGKSCDLTPMEFRLLEALVQSPRRVLTREQLLDRARAGNLEVGDRAIDIQIARIRKKLGDTDLIQTVRGVGYSLGCDIERL